ncbi:hypothetical protein GCM10022221_01140 [Actinocorallia aurea]
MPVSLSRRSLLAAAGLAGAGLATACAAPDLVPEPDVAVLLGAIADEENLISLYEKTASVLGDLPEACTKALADHRSHLEVLRKHYLPGTGGVTATPSATTSATAPAEPPADRASALALLRRTERAAAATRLKDVPAVSPGMSQLLASIGACETGHATALSLA